MLFFSILAGISPFLVAFLEDKFKISFLTSSSLTLLNFKLDLEWKFANFILWKILWFWKVSIILSRFALGSVLVCLSFNWVIMFVKWVFMMFAIISFSRTISLFSSSIIVFVFRPLLEKKWFYSFPEFFEFYKYFWHPYH